MRNFIGDSVVQYSAHCRSVLNYDKHLQRLIYLGYWGTKCAIEGNEVCYRSEIEAKTNINSEERKSTKLRKVNL